MEQNTKPHHNPNGGFRNPWDEWEDRGFSHILKWMWEWEKTPPIPSEEELPVVEPDFIALKNPPKDDVQITWIGHSTFLIQVDGFNILTDPVFSERASPVQWKGGPKRYRRTPCTIEQLPKIHVVVVSHNHYDHLDYNSIVQLHKLHDPMFYVPLKLDEWFKSLKVEKVKEMDWWDELDFNEMKITCLPCQHWSMRSGFDKNYSLWASFGFTINGKKILFCGDTGYNNQVFKEIGEKYGPIDLAFIPIGAYQPRWFMKPQHVDPEEAVQIAIEMKVKKAIGMHWGTFMLTKEPVLEPKERLAQELIKRGLPSNYFICVVHGKTNVLSKI